MAQDDGGMRVKLIRIRNVMGIEDLEIRPNKVTVVEGPNGSGKTSVVEAILAPFRGGHDPTLLRKGADEGEVYFLLDDDTEIDWRITEDDYDLRVTDPKRGKISAGKTWLDSVADSVSINPVEFMRSNDRVGVLMRAMPIQADPVDLMDALEDVPEDELDPEALVREVEGEHALTAISRVRKAVYDARTGVNRVAKEKRGTAQTLRDSLPADGADPGELASELDEVAEEHAEAKQNRSMLIMQAERTSKELVEKITANRDRRLEELRAEMERVKEDAAEQIDTARQGLAEEKEDIRGTFDPQIEELAGRLSRLEEQHRQAESAAETRNRAEQAETEALAHEAKSERMTDVLSRLDALKEAALSDLPIEGAEIEDGRLVVDGVPYERLNTTRRAEIAVEVAERLAGELPFMVVDDLELLDSEHFRAMVERIAASPLHAIVTRVSDGAFRVESAG